MAKDMLSQWIDNNPDVEEAFFEENFILEVYEKIFNEMQAQGITRTELANRLGKSKSYISQVFSGSRNLTLRTLADFCKALEVYPEINFNKYKVEKHRHYGVSDVGSHFESYEGEVVLSENFFFKKTSHKGNDLEFYVEDAEVA